MTASKDSTLFGNDDERTPAQRHDNEHESFASLPPGSEEPLFPAAPTSATHSWADSLTSSNGSGASHDAGEGSAWAETDRSLETPNTTYEWQPGVYPAAQNDSHDELYGSVDHGAYSNASNDAHTAVENFGYMAQEWPAESARDEYTERDEHERRGGYRTQEGTQTRNRLDELYAIPAAAEPMIEVPVPVAAPPTFAQSAPKPVLSERELLFNRHYAVLMDLMQHGAWPQALEKIRAMRTEFPEAPLDALLDEATLKTELMERWATKIKGRRLTVGQEWLIRRSLPFFLLLLLFVSGAVFYQTFVAPSRQVVAMERANQALVEEATNLLQVGQIDQAINLYNLVLTRNPEYAPAQQGLQKANSLFGLAVTYDVAIRVANSGNLKRSLVMLQSVKERSPSFRDIDARIARVESLLAAEKEYILAERAFAQHRWLDAVTHYQNTKALAEDYQAARVLLQLSQAYFMGAQWLMAHWPTPEFGAEQIRDFLRRAQQVNGQDETISAFLDDLERFMKGERSLRNDNLRQAVETWSKLYEEQPAFFGGYLAEQLYRTYLALAADVRAADPDYARELYTLAAEMPVHDSSEARIQLQKLGTVAPAAQPTPTPRPTIAYVAPAVVAPPPATPTPEPTATPANSYQGWIAFRTTRAGFEEIYVMRGDGSEQQLAPEEVRTRIDSLYQEERRSPDGRMVFVQSANGRSDANIYVVGSDGMNPAMLTDYNGDEYDPVWSPAGDRIVFVSNHTGNDEIWIMRADGGEQRQLTFNNWEWDKHPTWSPDSSQIAFFSNRSGQRQVWGMGTDGSAQRNLSNNNYDDWDPVWIK